MILTKIFIPIISTKIFIPTFCDVHYYHEAITTQNKLYDRIYLCKQQSTNFVCKKYYLFDNNDDHFFQFDCTIIIHIKKYIPEITRKINPFNFW